MHLSRRWMLLLVRKFTFWTPPPPELRTPVRQTYCGPVKDLQLVLRISDVREYPGVSYESSSTVVACTAMTSKNSNISHIVLSCVSAITSSYTHTPALTITCTQTNQHSHSPVLSFTCTRVHSHSPALTYTYVHSPALVFMCTYLHSHSPCTHTHLHLQSHALACTHLQSHSPCTRMYNVANS